MRIRLVNGIWVNYLKANVLLFYLVLFFFILLPLFNYAQIGETDKINIAVNETSVKRPNVYLDCNHCDFNYIRQQISYVNYVRDPGQADIHVFVTNQATGDGGRLYEFLFMGRNGFSATQFTRNHITKRDATFDEVRGELTRVINSGLASFLLQTPMSEDFKVKFVGDENGVNGNNNIDDPWKNWVFQVYVGSIRLNLESNKREFNSRYGFFADKVTDDWKFRLRPYLNYDQIMIRTSENDNFSVSAITRGGFDTYAIKSLGDHWSLGAFGNYFTFSSRNIRHEFRFTPGLEYSLFPYSEAMRKAITFRYQIGYSYLDYYRETVFGKYEESLYSQRLQGTVRIRQPWGNIETGFVGSHYFHDTSRRRIEFYGQVSVRLIEGLSLSFQTDYRVVHDQLALPKGEATLEEVLLKQRELATDYYFSTAIAITYMFGSRYANIVNTRF